jgi:hypothetical protein
MGEMRNEYKIVVGKSERKRPEVGRKIILKWILRK